MASDPLVCGIFRGMVLRLGGQEAATAVLRARFGEASTGHVSKMCAGQVGVTVEAAMALEDALGDAPLTEYLALRRGRIDLAHGPGSIAALAAMAAMASGQAQMALARAMDETGPGGAAITPAERGEIASAAMRMREAAEAMLAACGEARRGVVA